MSRDKPISIDERRARRAQFLQILYDATGGDTFNIGDAINSPILNRPADSPVNVTVSHQAIGAAAAPIVAGAAKLIAGL